MADLILKGPLNLVGKLNLEADGGRIFIGEWEALVEGEAQGSAPPVIQPPPPAGPINTGTTVKVISSFNKTIKAGGKNIVASGIVMQGDPLMWPGMMLPSMNNNEPVTINGIPANVQNDQATLFPSGGMAIFDTSGQ
jgi:hypothetical protein